MKTASDFAAMEHAGRRTYALAIAEVLQGPFPPGDPAPRHERHPRTLGTGTCDRAGWVFHHGLPHDGRTHAMRLIQYPNDGQQVIAAERVATLLDIDAHELIDALTATGAMIVMRPELIAGEFPTGSLGAGP